MYVEDPVVRDSDNDPEVNVQLDDYSDFNVQTEPVCRESGSPNASRSDVNLGAEQVFLGSNDPRENVHASEEVPLRRSSRSRKAPSYLGDFICHSQNEVLSGWQKRIGVLLEMLNIFPDNKNDILSAMLLVLTSCN